MTGPDGQRAGIVALLVIGALVLACPTSWAQYNTAEITGVIKDAAGGVLPGVHVVATHRATGLKVERVSDGAGLYLPAGAAGRRLHRHR